MNRNNLFNMLIICVLGGGVLLPQSAKAQFDVVNFDFITKEIAQGTYALLSSSMGVDNNGFVVGEHGVLVIDAHVTGANAQRIQKAVREITDKPILYVVNTNYSSDHTFGNYAFPAETQIVAHVRTVELMRKHFVREKRDMMSFLENGETVLADVKMRLPNLTFSESLRIDLGGRWVELYYFGPAHEEGDIVVYVPDAKVAWTGNMVSSEGIIWDTNLDYLTTLSKLNETLDVAALIPSHGSAGEASLSTSRAIMQHLLYTTMLAESIKDALRVGQSLEETEASLSFEKFTRHLGSDQDWTEFLPGIHKGNIRRIYRELSEKL